MFCHFFTNGVDVYINDVAQFALREIGDADCSRSTINLDPFVVFGVKESGWDIHNELIKELGIKNKGKSGFLMQDCRWAQETNTNINVVKLISFCNLKMDVSAAELQNICRK